jgi:hypothetical protein
MISLDPLGLSIVGQLHRRIPVLNLRHVARQYFARG